MLLGLFGNLVGSITKGIATIIGFFTKLRSGAEAVQYLSGEQLDAAAAASSLEGQVTGLTSSLNVQREAVEALTRAYTQYVTGANTAAANLPQGFRAPTVAPRQTFATGGIVGGTGNKDTEPALLTPGEFVINAEASKKFAPLLAAINEGRFGEYSKGRIPFRIGNQVVELSIASQQTENAINRRIAEASSIGEGALVALATALNGLADQVGMKISQIDASLRGIPELSGMSSIQQKKYSAPEWIRSQSETMDWGTRSSEIAAVQSKVTSVWNQYGEITEKQLDNLIVTQASHLQKMEDEFGNKIWSPENLTPDLGSINNYLNRVETMTFDTAQGSQVMSELVDRVGMEYSQVLIEVEKLKAGIHPQTREAYQVLDALAAMDENYSIQEMESAKQARLSKTQTEKLRTILGTKAISGYQATGALATTQIRLADTGPDAFIETQSQRYYTAGESSALSAVAGAENGQLSGSDSRKMMEVGDDFVGGYVTAINNGRGDVVKASQAMTEAAVQSAKSGSSDIRQVLKEQLGVGPLVDKEQKELKETVALRKAENRELLKRARLLAMQGYSPDVAKRLAAEQLASQRAAAAAPTPSLFPPGTKSVVPEGAKMLPVVSAEKVKAATEKFTNETTQATKKMGGIKGAATKFGGALKNGSLKMQGAFFALDGLVFAASMMNNSFGEMAQKALPVVFGLQGISMVLPMLKGIFAAMLSPAGLLVGGLIALVGGVVLLRKRVDNMFDSAIDAGIEAAGSMKKIAESADIFAKGIRSLAPEKLRIAPQKQSKVAEYFETEEGQVKLEELITQRQELGRTGFAEDLGKQIAFEAATKGLTGKEIEAYIAEIANQLGDEKLYVDLKGELVELLDPQGGGSNILKDGLFIDIKAELAGEFIRGEANFTQQMQKDVMNSLAQVEQFLDPSAIQERAVQDAVAIGNTYEDLGKQIEQASKELDDALASGNQKYIDEADKRLQELKRQQMEVMSGMPTATNIDVAGRMKGLETPAETQKAFEKAAEAAAKYGKSLFLNRQAMALYNDAVERGAISQKEYEKMAAGVATQFIRVKKFAFEAIDTLQELDDTTALKRFREAFSEQAFAGIDEELRTKVTDALKEVSDKAVVTLGVEYARGSITEQEIIDLANVIDRLPTDQAKQTKIIIAYGEGSLTSANLEVLANNLENISSFDGKQINYLLNLGVLGEEAFAQAIAMMVAADKMLSGETTFIAGQYSAIGTELSKFTQQANEAKAMMDKLFGETGGGVEEGAEVGEDKGGSGGGSKTETWLEGLIKEISANLKLFVGNVRKGIPPIVGELRALGIPEQLIDAIGAGPDGLKKSKELLDLSQKQRKRLIENYNKSVVGEAVAGIESQLQMKQQKDLARIKLEDRGIEKDLIKEILEDEEAIFTILFGTNKQVKQLISGYKELQEETDPLEDAIKKARKEQERILDAVDQQIDAQQEVINGIQSQIDAIEERNDVDQNIIRDKQRQIEMIERQIDATERLNEADERRIEALNRESELRDRVSEALSRELDKMSEVEDEIRDAYQKRIDALDKVASINDYIIDQQRQQLDLSRAVSEGDIYAATAAAQAMRAASAGFATGQVRSALEQGMENQVAGLRTSGGLTREQAEQQIANISEQNYQTSLLIRDIEDVIYQRNLELIPLKDQIRSINDQILIIEDRIYDRETEILNITNQRLKPEQSILAELQKQRETTLKKTEDNIEALELSKDLDDSVIAQGENVNSLAQAWHNVAKEIKKAKDIATGRIDELGTGPAKEQFEKDIEGYRKAIRKWNADRAAIIAQRDRDIAEQLAKGNAALDAALQFAGQYAGGMVESYGMGGKIKKYRGGGVVSGMQSLAYGGSVLGSGGRDSVPTMLMPGEFVVRKAMVDKYGSSLMEKINQGSFVLPKYDTPKFDGEIKVNKNNVSNINAPVYNTYDMKFAISGSNASPEDIANRVMFKMKQVQDQGIRGNRGY
jgi:hypothetical protein